MHPDEPLPALEEWSWFCENARAPLVRSMREFAEAEVRIPEGQYQGRRLRLYRQPKMGLLFDAFDVGTWRRRAVTDCVQSGKTLGALVVPILYHLFECRHDVIFGAPSMEVCKKKWFDEILPVINRTRYRCFLPTIGRGSQGGWSEEIHLTNGTKLIFMGAKGGDERRSGATGRILAITEVDKADQASQTSRESDPITQMENRLSSYPKHWRIVYLECTVSIVEGRIWQEIIKGTDSRIACPCVHCGEYVTPGREHLQGWQQAETEIQAERLSYFVCPACGEAIDDDDRRRMNGSGVLLHAGQEIAADGQVTGQPPETDTLGFKASGFNNLFWTIGEIGQKEWQKLRAVNEEAAEKELCQFYWAVPYEPPEMDVAALDADQVRRRFADRRYTKGVVPEDTEYLTCGADVHKRLIYWLLAAWRPEARGHVVDYGAIEVASDDMALPRALAVALDELHELLMTGFTTPDGKICIPDQVWIDTRYMGQVIYPFCRRTKNRFRPALGCGRGKQYPQGYTHPKTLGKVVRRIGDDYHVRWSEEHHVHTVNVNGDPWKSYLHNLLRSPAGEPGSMVAYHSSDPNEHMRLSKHFTAEQPEQIFIPGEGTVTKWKKISSNNHLLDCGYNACAAGHFCGVRVVRPAATATSTRRGRAVKPTIRMPDGRPFLVTER